jgi:ABC-2 type transport system ATP-binding protein
MIEVSELTKRFGSTTAVNGLSFTVHPGHVTGFLGPNGAGKSTTMRMMVGLDRPTGGTVTINGRPYPVVHRPLHQVGTVLDVRAVHGGRSAYNHLLCLAQSNGIGRRRVGEVLQLVGLADVGRRRAGAFSLGMSQRLGLAAALLGDPPVLICDEPVNGLDPEGIRWIRTLLRSLAAEGRTVFVSSHLMSEMALTADRLIVIGEGRLLAEGSTADLIAASSGNTVLVRSPRSADLQSRLLTAGASVTISSDPATLLVAGLTGAVIGDLAAGAGIPLHELTPQNASLETAYRDLTAGHAAHHTEPAAPGSGAPTHGSGGSR